MSIGSCEVFNARREQECVGKRTAAQFTGHIRQQRSGEFSILRVTRKMTQTDQHPGSN